MRTINEDRAFEAINYHESNHVPQVQRSRYIAIHDEMPVEDAEKIKKTAPSERTIRDILGVYRLKDVEELANNKGEDAKLALHEKTQKLKRLLAKEETIGVKYMKEIEIK